jgi:hypothetical protein
MVKTDNWFHLYDIFILITETRNLKLLLKCLKELIKWSYLYCCIYSLDYFNYIPFLSQKVQGFYLWAWVKWPFCKVSENFKFWMNKIFKERTKNYVTFLNNPCNYICLVYVIKDTKVFLNDYLP